MFLKDPNVRFLLGFRGNMFQNVDASSSHWAHPLPCGPRLSATFKAGPRWRSGASTVRLHAAGLCDTICQFMFLIIDESVSVLEHCLDPHEDVLVGGFNPSENYESQLG